HGEDLPVEIARFDAPALHGEPGDDRQIELGFLRYPAVDGASGPPIVFLLDDVTETAVSEPLIVRLRELGDVILFNRRGYGFSSPPPPCPARLNYPFDAPLIQGRLTEVTCEHAVACLDAMNANGLTPAVFAEDAVTEDLELLAQVLEAEQMHIVAADRLASVALDLTKRFPERVARVAILDRSANDSVNVSSDAIATLEEGLKRAPAEVTYVSSGRQDISIRIGELDLAFLQETLSSDPVARNDLLSAAKQAANGDYDALAEMAVRMRQQLGEVASIKLLQAGGAESCMTRPTEARVTPAMYAEHWPQSALGTLKPDPGKAGMKRSDHRKAPKHKVRYFVQQKVAGESGTLTSVEADIINYLAGQPQ
ncbi:MAG: hypothetical protein WDZ60_03715, partial [Wenzhouxiangellaceae bacterium]